MGALCFYQRVKAVLSWNENPESEAPLRVWMQSWGGACSLSSWHLFACVKYL